MQLPYYYFVRDKVLRYICEQALLHAGDRVAVAVSGGVDSVALLRVLLELRAELGIVLAAAHFNHGLRGTDSDADEAFVAELAKEHELEFFAGHGNVRDHAQASKLSLEAAGRELRYGWFARLAAEQRLDCIATAHTLDDQAETVLLKLLRGAGTKGLAGIWPIVKSDVPLGQVEEQAPRGLKPACDDNKNKWLDGAAKAAPLHSRTELGNIRIVRPLLGVTRVEVENYLQSLGQSWREDTSNRDRRLLRNRVRHELLPLLEREYNPRVRQLLSDAAEIARAEEEYWQRQVERELSARVTAERLRVGRFSQLPLAVQRRVLKGFAESRGLTLDFEHTEKLRRCALGEISRADLPGGKIAVHTQGWLEFRSHSGKGGAPYEVVLPVPGEVQIAELQLALRATVVPEELARERPPAELLSRDLIGTELLIRNWRPGDRFWLAYSRSEEKLKRLFAEKHIPEEQRASWPVALCGAEIVWVRGFPVAKAYRWSGKGDAVKIQAVSVSS